MKKQFLPLMLLASAMCACSGSQQAEPTEPMITKTEIQVENGQFTPEIMHRLGKVSDVQVSPDHSKILYGVTYTSIEQNKGNRELYLMNVDGSDNVKITNTPKSESNARWLSDSQIIYMRSGKLYTATIEGATLKNEIEVAG
ncbi:MAG: peptidase S9, partial [Bacteroidaceae bacterium]|nr:peptidase S9 [Bacteroidaceae bacterium]